VVVNACAVAIQPCGWLVIGSRIPVTDFRQMVT